MAHLCSLQWLLWTPVMTPHSFILAFKPLLSQVSEISLHGESGSACVIEIPAQVDMLTVLA